jgi:hypothetical protein
VPERPIHTNGRAPIVKMSRSAQQMVPVIHRRPAAVQEPAGPAPLSADQFASARAVVLAILERESGLSAQEVAERCHPLRTSVTPGSWQTTLYDLKRAGHVVSAGERGEKRWSLRRPVTSPEKGAA